tara:strand:- start:1531 stop:1914 length:384 start_codon:yes stop_codon:yes gene_type:complete
MNNTTEEDFAETCMNALNETIDCVVLGSSSIFDDIEVIIVALAALAGIGVFLYKKYLVLNADGKITLDELLDAVDDVKDKAKEAKKEIAKIESTLASKNVTELKEMLKEKGLSVKGKKADLIARLEE